MAYDVLVVGRPSCDLVFTGLPAWPGVGRETYAGGLTVGAGGAFNIVAALHRLGLRAGLIGLVGDDPWSRLCLTSMRDEGVSTDLLLALDRPTPSVSVCMTHGGDRGFLSYEPSSDEIEDRFRAHAEDVLAREDAAFVQCCLTPTLPRLAAAARARGTRVVVDCGWDEPWLSSEAIRDLLPLADVVFTNQPEACTIAGTSDPLAAISSLGTIHPFVVVKRGADGSSVAVNGRPSHAPTEPVAVVDATGAGDCFNAGFLYGLLRGAPVEVCLRLGNICGGLSVGAPGGYSAAPSEAELLGFAADRGVSLAPAAP